MNRPMMDMRAMRDMMRGRGRRGMMSGRGDMAFDGRNPYGSRGGYVTSGRRGRRDRAMEEDMARGMDRERGRGRDRGSNDYGSYDSEYDSRYDNDYGTGEYNTRDSVYGRELYGYYGDTPFEIRRGYSMQDREMDYARGRGRDREMDYDEDMDYARGGRGGGRGRGRDRAMDYAGDYARGGRGRDRGMDYGYDYRGDYGMDYGEGDYKLEKQDIEEWTKKLMKGIDDKEKEMFQKEKVLNKAKEMGVKFEDFTPEEFYVTVLMVYTDYCKTLGSANIDLYLRLAKDWLMDDDVEMKYSEKLASYYDNVVMPE